MADYFPHNSQALKCKYAVQSFVSSVHNERNLAERYRNLRTDGIVKSIRIVFFSSDFAPVLYYSKRSTGIHQFYFVIRLYSYS